MASTLAADVRASSPSFVHTHSPDGKVYYHVHRCLLSWKLDLRWPAIKFKSQLNVIKF